MHFVSKIAVFAVKIATATAHECVMHATQVTTPVPPAPPEEPVNYYKQMAFGSQGVTLQLDGQDVAAVYTRRIIDQFDIDFTYDYGTPIAEDDSIYWRRAENTRLSISSSFSLSEDQTLSFYSCALSESHLKYHCVIVVKEKDTSLQTYNYRVSSDYFSQEGDDPLQDGESFDKYVEVYNENPLLLHLIDTISDITTSLEIRESIETYGSILYSDYPLDYAPFCNQPLSDIDRVLGIVLEDEVTGVKHKISGQPHPFYYADFKTNCGWTETETETYYTSTCTDSIPDNSYYLKVQLAMTLFNITILWYCFVYGYLFLKDLKTIDPPEEELQCEETPSVAGCRDILDDFEEPVIIVDF